MDVPNINIQHNAVFFDVLCEHDPPGVLSEETVDNIIRVQCWVKLVAAFNPEQAGRKAERFLTETRGVHNIKVTRWRFSSRQQKGVKPNGKLLT